MKAFLPSLTVDECEDALGFSTIRVADGSVNGDTSAAPIATVYIAEFAQTLAAAPDLLAAAQAVLNGGSWNDDGSFVYWPPDGSSDDDEGAIGDLSAAIAKATGAAKVEG